MPPHARCATVYPDLVGFKAEPTPGPFKSSLNRTSRYMTYRIFMPQLGWWGWCNPVALPSVATIRLPVIEQPAPLACRSQAPHALLFETVHSTCSKVLVLLVAVVLLHSL